MDTWAVTTDRGISPHPEGFSNIRGFAQKATKKSMRRDDAGPAESNLQSG